MAGLCALVAGGCGGGERQDANEPEGTFRVDVTEASFPREQKLAKKSEIEISVRNTGRETVPNIAVTLRGLDVEIQDPDVADASRPRFLINGEPKRIGDFAEAKETAPEGGETSYVDTWALGPLKRGEEKTFRWEVTAVRAGTYRLTYSVAAGLDGKAKAVDETGNRPGGLFIGTVSDEPPDTRVAEDGKTVIRGTR